MEGPEGRRRYEVEAILSEYESKGAIAIKKLRYKEQLTSDERSDLSIFMVLMYLTL